MGVHPCQNPFEPSKGDKVGGRGRCKRHLRDTETSESDWWSLPLVGRVSKTSNSQKEVSDPREYLHKEKSV